MNVVALKGVLARAPESRQLASGEELLTYEVTVREDGRPAVTVPVVWIDAPGHAAALDADTEVVVTGRVRRRFFRAAGATASRTEVVADAVLPARHRAKSSRLVATALERLDA